jgi:SMC interacting uncharacterized protein involved in chromosome segregation
VVALSNDVAEREEELMLLRKREKVYQQRLASRAKSQELEDQVRAQLFKRLEDILIEKEDLSEALNDV